MNWNCGGLPSFARRGICPTAIHSHVHKPRPTVHWFIRHGENSGHVRSTPAAHSVVLSVWQAVHESGIFADCAVAGAMKRKVCARTLTSAMVGWIFGMWQPTHSLPGEPGA